MYRPGLICIFTLLIACSVSAVVISDTSHDEKVKLTALDLYTSIKYPSSYRPALGSPFAFGSEPDLGPLNAPAQRLAVTETRTPSTTEIDSNPKPCGDLPEFNEQSTWQFISGLISNVACSYSNERVGPIKNRKPLGLARSTPLKAVTQFSTVPSSQSPPKRPSLQALIAFNPPPSSQIQSLPFDSNNAFRLPTMYLAGNQSSWFNLTIPNMDVLFFLSSCNVSTVKLYLWRTDYGTSQVVYESSVQTTLTGGLLYSFLSAMTAENSSCATGRRCNFLLQVLYNDPTPAWVLVSGTFGYMLGYSRDTMGALYIGQTDYFAIKIRNGDTPVAIAMQPDPSNSRIDIDMFVWRLGRPSVQAFPTNVNPLHFGNVQEVAFIDSGPSFVPDYYIVQVFPASQSLNILNQYLVVSVPNYQGSYNTWYNLTIVSVLVGMSLLVLLVMGSMCLMWVRRRNRARDDEAAAWAAAGRHAPPEVATAAEIEALPVAAFCNGMYPLEDAVCAICLCEYGEAESIKTLPCAHHFHSECVNRWLIQARYCPLCHQNLESAVVRSSSVAAPADVPLPSVVPVSAPPASSVSEMSIMSPTMVTLRPLDQVSNQSSESSTRSETNGFLPLVSDSP